MILYHISLSKSRGHKFFSEKSRLSLTQPANNERTGNWPEYFREIRVHLGNQLKFHSFHPSERPKSIFCGTRVYNMKYSYYKIDTSHLPVDAIRPAHDTAPPFP